MQASALAFGPTHLLEQPEYALPNVSLHRGVHGQCKQWTYARLSLPLSWTWVVVLPDAAAAVFSHPSPALDVENAERFHGCFVALLDEVVYTGHVPPDP